ncbi:MICOS complex subunit MIC27 isoform X2 [Myripristis murdjan]|uniref:MICOS complex subunit n=2 Tax=Myripristis murdjan TaxID=586833 RepID=A0A668A8V7_9TELE|nr:MICOS complex subunit Mic27-like isoform X2 [Myripristis murdjan]XP_029917767.1 MICOS complex subunit Mic27-like isoform X2 [Myripristis murdjan]
MVAVPTVLGIASIRVYRVSDAPPDGLISRETLSVYTPVPQSPLFHFVAEKPGALESGLTKVRETILPLVQAAQGACVSVKKGSVNLYHAGEDVYYYLKDPPPGFLPRLGTITMAGLLGMFLARKGSRFKRVAVPLGLMSAGASVCYPAQAVAVLKLTGKRLYAAGQWSSASVSSLFTSKSKEHVAKELASSQTQSATVPKPESPVVEEVHSAPCHVEEPSSPTDSPAQPAATTEAEIESVELVPVSDEPASATTTEGLTSITHTQIPPDEGPTQPTADAVVKSVPAESTLNSLAPPSPVESEEPLDSKQALDAPSAEASPDQIMPTSEAETVVESVPTEPTPAAEEPPAPAPSDQPAESSESEPAPEELAEKPVVAAVEEPTAPEQAAAENTTEGSGFQADPALMDFGQSNPEDEDMYSTRS